MATTFESLTSEQPDIKYNAVRTALLAEGVAQEVEPLRDAIRADLLSRLGGSENTYHEEGHSKEVVMRTGALLDNLADPDMLTDRQKDLVLEAALRHDDDHAGDTYRQRAVGGELSNEEVAAAHAIEELRGVATAEELEFVEGLILATSFGQNAGALTKEFGDDEGAKEKMERPYAPATPAQKLLALADIGGFVKGWDEWIDESERLSVEQGGFPGDSLDDWLANRLGFAQGYIKGLVFPGVRELLKPEYYYELLGRLQEVIDTVLSLQKEGEGRDAYAERFAEIKAQIASA
jgi:hypothetical protein